MTVEDSVYEAAVLGRKQFREAFRLQKKQSDRYALALRMICEQVRDVQTPGNKIAVAVMKTAMDALAPMPAPMPVKTASQRTE